MTVRLVLESAPHRQSQTEREFHGGRMVIGRSEDADWQLNDPDMFVSRRHCILSDETGEITATDASSSGLFIDNSANPVGAGNSVPLESGMHLRLGDFVFRVEMMAAGQGDAATASQAPKAGSPFDFGPQDKMPVDPPKRPESLPDPFGLREETAARERKKQIDRPPEPLDRQDPFELDLRGTFSRTEPEAGQSARPDTGPSAPISGGGYFDEPANSLRPVAAPEADQSGASLHDTENAPVLPGTDVFGAQPSADQLASGEFAALRAALYRGMGLDPARFDAPDPTAEMEAIGRRLRDLVDGVMMLLRARAQEKQKVRVAQTIIANADVNPLKFLVTTDEALAALIQPRGKGYLPPDEAVVAAFRDLSDHQVRTWTALQAALRRMIDKFDPEEVEKEIEDTGLLEKLIAGGRHAKLWQLYQQRYREMARSAEEEFLGDVGADFRDAYDNQRRK